MAFNLSSTTDIEASPHEIWAVLSDLSAWSEWNPFIFSATGEPVVGSTLTLKMRDTQGGEMTFTPKVLVADAPGELRWLGRLLMPGVFDGEHLFTLTDLGDGRTRLTQSENFKGLLVPFMTKRLRERTGPQFEAMNAALAARVAAVRG
ncbi:SRPBCC domain-containing protein [Phytomonospora sp. NPDC050363]|uniref:SRPBCC domain-containing protein n=1 Tax=Phytomonospora sp. NPDC050363 TaxID=3155642 RepID=UPI0033CDA9FB